MAPTLCPYPPLPVIDDAESTGNGVRHISGQGCHLQKLVTRQGQPQHRSNLRDSHRCTRPSSGQLQKAKFGHVSGKPYLCSAFRPWPTYGRRAGTCGNSSVGRAQPCQGWGREFESRFPLTVRSNGGIGRHERLKIFWPVMAVRVQVPLRVQSIAPSGAFIVLIQPSQVTRSRTWQPSKQ